MPSMDERIKPRYTELEFQLIVYAISCRPELDDDVISGEMVKALEGYVVVNLKLIYLVVSEILKQESPPIGVAVRNVTSLIPQRQSTNRPNTCYHLFRKSSCMTVHRLAGAS